MSQLGEERKVSIGGFNEKIGSSSSNNITNHHGSKSNKIANSLLQEMYVEQTNSRTNSRNHKQEVKEKIKFL